MIRLNLLPLKETERALGRRQQVSLLLLGIAIALLIMIVPFIIQGRQLASLDGQIDQLNQEIQQFNAQVKEVHELERLKREVTTKLNIIQDLNRKRVGPSRVLEAVGGRCEVLLDGGITCGQDVLKAVGLGARACLVGRSFLYGLAVRGEPGVSLALDILRREFEISMALTGVQDARHIGHHVLVA